MPTIHREEQLLLDNLVSQLQERIAQFRNMAENDPDNELGHYRLGQLLMEADQPADAEKSFRRTLEISPQFSKVYELLGQCLVKLDRKDEAIETLKSGFAVADERGDKIPRDNMSRLLVELGEEAPKSQRAPEIVPTDGPGGFNCQSPQCMMGGSANQLPSPPMGGEMGMEIYEKVCSQCWDSWKRDYSIKVINELHLDLSTEAGSDAYDKHMRDYLGLDQPSADPAT